MKKNSNGIIVIVFFVFFIMFAVTSFLNVGNGNAFFILPLSIWIVMAIVIFIAGFSNFKKNQNKQNHIINKPNEKDIFDKYDGSKKEQNGQIKCSLCGALNDANSNYCKVCGEELYKNNY